MAVPEGSEPDEEAGCREVSLVISSSIIRGVLDVS